jgi:hypothetical protein
VHSVRLPRVARACLNSGFMGIPFFWRGAVADRVPAQLCWLSTALALLGLVRGNSRVSSNCSELDNALSRGDGARITYAAGFLDALRRSSVSLRKLIRPGGADAPHQDAGEGLRALFGMHCLREGNNAIAGSGQLLLCKINVTNTITCMKPDCHCARSYIVCEPLLEVQIKANTLEGCLQAMAQPTFTRGTCETGPGSCALNGRDSSAQLPVLACSIFPQPSRRSPALRALAPLLPSGLDSGGRNSGRSSRRREPAAPRSPRPVLRALASRGGPGA